MSLDNHLKPTLDMPGVLGLFCLTSSGQLLVNRLPSAYRDSIFVELGTRCTTFLAAVDLSYTPTDEYVIRFEDHSLYLHKTDSLIIGVLCAGDVMLAGLRVSINLLLKSAKEAILTLPVIDPAASSSAPAKAAGGDEAIEDEVILPAKTKADDSKPKEETKRRGFFGFGGGGKGKTGSSSDIWG